MTLLFLVSFRHSTNLLLLNHFWRNLLLILTTWKTGYPLAAELSTKFLHCVTALYLELVHNTYQTYQVYTSSRCLRSSSDTRILTIPPVKTKFYGQRSFAYQAPTIWNKLPLKIRHQGTTDCLKRALKLICFDFSRHSLTSSILCCLEFLDVTYILITVRACLTIIFSFL